MASTTVLANGMGVGPLPANLVLAHDDAHVVVRCFNNPDFTVVIDRATDAVVAGNLRLGGYRTERCVSLYVRHDDDPHFRLSLLESTRPARCSGRRHQAARRIAAAA